MIAHWISNFVAGLFAGIWFYAVLLAIGFCLGFALTLVGRVFGGAAAGAACAIVLVVLYATDAVDRFTDARTQKEIAELTAANKAKAAKIEEIRATNAVLAQTLELERAAAELNAPVLAELEAKIKAAGDNPACNLSGDFIDELEKLR